MKAKQKILIVLMALVLPMMVSCGGDDNEVETPTVSNPNFVIYGYWTCTSYIVGGVDMSTNGYFILFTERAYHTKMPCFNSSSGIYTLNGIYLNFNSDQECLVNGKGDTMVIHGETRDGKPFKSGFVKK